MALKGNSANLDILRAFAVTAVLVNHLAQLTPGGLAGGPWALNAIGRAGVLIFFVHTALVLMGSLERLEARGGDLHLVRAFYVQRFFRLYPLSVACVALVMGVHFAVPGWRLPWLTWRAVAANLALVQNLTWDRPVIWPLWSLPYEVQMYLVLPAIYLLTKQRRALLYLTLLWLAGAAVGSYLFWADARYLTAAYQYPVMWFVPTFLGGVFAFVLMRGRGANLPAVLWPALIVGILIAFQMFPLRRGELAMSLLGFAIPQFREMRNGVVRAMAHNIAKYSYGVYLLHAPLLEMCFVHLRSLPIAVRCGLFFVLLVVSSVGAYHLIEKPMIDVGHRLARRIAGRRESGVGMVVPVRVLGQSGAA